MELNAAKKIYIPERIKSVSVAFLPISNNLAEFFNEHKVKVISDLQKINVELLNKTTASGEKPFPELRHYILAFQESTTNEIILVADTNNRQARDINKTESEKRSRSIATILTEKILFPLPAQKWRISALPVSQQLINKLQMSGCGKLADVHGIPYANFSRLKSFEEKDVIELYSFITQLQSITGFRSAETKVSAADVEIKTDETKKTSSHVIENNVPNIDVSLLKTNSPNQDEQATNSNAPETIQTLTALNSMPISYLAPSDELQARLKKANIIFVGQLQNLSYDELADAHDFDAENISELQTLLSFAKKSARYKEFPRDFTLIKRDALVRKEKEAAKRKSFLKLYVSGQDPEKQTQSVKSDVSEVIEIPSSLKDLPIGDLAPSDKLNRSLRKIKIYYAGQLKGITYYKLIKRHAFDAKDISELQILVSFAKKFARYARHSGGVELIKKAALKRRESESATQKSFDAFQVLVQLSKEQNQAAKPNENLTQNDRNGTSKPDVVPTLKIAVPAISTQKFVIPEPLKELRIDKFTLSIPLTIILNELGIRVVGDFEKISYRDFTNNSLCTQKEKSGLWELLFQIQNSELQVAKPPRQSYFQLEPLDLAGLMDFINRFLAKLPSLEKEILIDRFGGASDEQVLKFEAIANKYQTSRERAYQIHVKTLSKLKEKIEQRVEKALEKLSDDCITSVCPLTPKFLVHLTDKKYEIFQYSPAFYIRIFGAISPKLPVLPEIKNQIITLTANAKKIEQEIKSILENCAMPVSLPEIFNRVMIYSSNKEIGEGDFFEAVQSIKFNLIATNNSNELFIEPNGLK